MQRIGVLYNPLSRDSIHLSLTLSQWLRDRDLAVWRGISQEGRHDPESLYDLDLMVALGGDGTVLRAARLSILCGRVPVLPVALGHLNFMAELQPDELYDGLAKLFEGGGWQDERALAAATIYSQGQTPKRVIALNEVLVARGEVNRTMTVDVEIYNTRLATYQADGVIVATATGSTAYAQAAGGPIIDPRSRALTLVPIAAHLTHIPSLVLDEDAVVTLRNRSRYPGVFAADGRENVPLHEGDVVEIHRAQETCVFARVHPPSAFYARMAQRLRPSD